MATIQNVIEISQSTDPGQKGTANRYVTGDPEAEGTGQNKIKKNNKHTQGE